MSEAMVSPWSFGFFKMNKSLLSNLVSLVKLFGYYFLKNKAVSPTAVTTIAFEFAF